MTTQTMKTYTFENQTFAIFEKSEKGGVWMVQFIWGKKDFRLYLSRKGEAQGADLHGPTLFSEATGEVIPTRLQYLNAFEWYDHSGVGGHGLSREEVRWSKGNLRRYVELPKDFLDTAIEIACREFGLERRPEKLAS